MEQKYRLKRLRGAGPLNDSYCLQFNEEKNYFSKNDIYVVVIREEADPYNQNLSFPYPEMTTHSEPMTFEEARKHIEAHQDFQFNQRGHKCLGIAVEDEGGKVLKFKEPMTISRK